MNQSQEMGGGGGKCQANEHNVTYFVCTFCMGASRPCQISIQYANVRDPAFRPISNFWDATGKRNPAVYSNNRRGE